MPARQDFHDLLSSFVRSYRYLAKCDRYRCTSTRADKSPVRSNVTRLYLSLSLSFSPFSSFSSWHKMFAADSIDES